MQRSEIKFRSDRLLIDFGIHCARSERHWASRRTMYAGNEFIYDESMNIIYVVVPLRSLCFVPGIELYFCVSFDLQNVRCSPVSMMFIIKMYKTIKFVSRNSIKILRSSSALQFTFITYLHSIVRLTKSLLSNRICRRTIAPWSSKL